MKIFRNQNTVDYILLEFNTTISDLRKIEADQIAEVNRQAAIAATAAAKNERLLLGSLVVGVIVNRFKARVAGEVGEW